MLVSSCFQESLCELLTGLCVLMRRIIIIAVLLWTTLARLRGRLEADRDSGVPVQ